MRERKATVYVKNKPAAVLVEHAQPGIRRYELQYLPDYLEQKPCFPISLRLSPRPAPYFAEHLFPFFQNMLPEGENKKLTCKACKLDEDDLFGMLVHLAKYDTVGDVTVQEITNS